MKVGLIGAGNIAQAHLRHGWPAVEDAEIVAAADIIVEKAQETAERFDIPHAFEDYHEILAMDDVEAVDICTYNQSHMQPAVDALNAGKHVFVEKPMAAFLDDAVAMVRAAKQNDRILMCGVKSRYNGTWIAARKFAQSGKLGDIYYAQASGGRRRGVPGRTFIRKETAGRGAVVDTGVYTIDNVLWVMGHPKPVSVDATVSNFIGTQKPLPIGAMREYDPDTLEVEDFGAAFIRFENGAVFSYMGAWAQHMDPQRLTYFLGTEAGLSMDPFTIYRDEAGYMTNTAPLIPETDNRATFGMELADFANAVAKGLPSPIPMEEVLLANVVMQGIFDSAEAGHAVALEVPEI
jgi:predicted dehydrogenase